MNKGDKKSLNNNISSYQINLSGVSGTEGLNISSGNVIVLASKNLIMVIQILFIIAVIKYKQRIINNEDKHNEKILIINKGIIV